MNLKWALGLLIILLVAFYAYNDAKALPNDSYVKIPDEQSVNPTPTPTNTPVPTSTTTTSSITNSRIKPAVDWYIGIEVLGHTKDGRTVTLYKKSEGLFYAGTGNVPSYQYDLESVSLVPTLYVKSISGERWIKVIDVYGYLTTCYGARIKIPGTGAPTVVKVVKAGKFQTGAYVTIDENTLMNYFSGKSCNTGVLSLNVVIQTDTGYAFGYKASIFVKLAEAGDTSTQSTGTQTSTSTSTPSPSLPNPTPKPIIPLFERITDVSLEPLWG